MSKTSIASAAVALLAFAGVCIAQPPGITPEMIARALPFEGAPLAEPGPYEVTSEPAFGSPGLMVFHPTKLDAFPKTDTLPVMVWGNGGCSIDTTRYRGFLTTIASHGFVALGYGRLRESRRVPAGHRRQPARRHRLGGSGNQARGLAAERQDRDGQGRRHGPVVRRIHVDHPRCRSACRYDRRVQFRRPASANPGAQPAPGRTPEALKALHGPVLIINGHEPDFMWRSGEGDVRHDQQCADFLRLPAQRRPHRDGLPPGRRRVRERRVELAQVDVQRR